ncbi:hypothetical protein D3C84_1261600 [compost metagenome]
MPAPICSSVLTPDIMSAANVPPIMTAAEIMTPPVVDIALDIAYVMPRGRYSSLNLAIKKML